MKKRLIFTAAAFLLVLAAVTGWAEKEPVQPDLGSFIVSANETAQLIEKGDYRAARESAEALKTALSDYTPEQGRGGSAWLVFAVCAVTILALFSYVYVAILRPFEKLTGFAEQIAGGNFDLPLHYERTNYFGKFTWAFDCMRREISTARASEKAAIENNKTVIASLSHDLKTPVASIRAYAEGLEAGLDGDVETRARYLAVIMRKCDELAALTNDMLLHAVSDMDRLKITPEKFALCSFTQETVGELSVRNPVSLHLPEEELFVTADKTRMVQVFENILTNAAKYAKTPVDLSAERTDRGVEIRFRDFGPGVPEDELPFLFDKFYRGSRTAGETGAGLGLYIVKYIVTRCGGACFAENLPDGFQIRILF